MRIAICDDEQKELRHLQALVKEFDSSIDISAYPSSENLLVDIKKADFDILLLDIEMSGMNGYDAAKKITSMDNPPLIIFITNSGKYLAQGYGIAFRYLPKPVDYATLAEIIALAIDEISPQRFSVDINGRIQLINIKDIMYIEASGHYINIFAKQNKYECRMKLSDIESTLPGNLFSSPHKSYLVNLNFVDSVEDNDIILINNLIIPISRRRKQEFETALFRSVRRV